MTANTVTLGSISHGTLRPEDLIPQFVMVAEGMGLQGKAVDAAKHLILAELMSHLDGTPRHDNISEVLNDLMDALNDAAPPFTRFGAHEGDGSDFGFWVDHERLDEAISSGEVVRVNPGAIPRRLDAEFMLERSEDPMSASAALHRHDAENNTYQLLWRV